MTVIINAIQNTIHIRIMIPTIGLGSSVLINHNTGEAIKTITDKRVIPIRNRDMVSLKIFLIFLIMLSHFLKLSIVDSSSI